jgi:sugar fermentation stimulation protein A
MKFSSPLLKGTLVKRYKRFMADIVLENGETITAHCANSGSMLGCKDEGATVWVSPANNPERKLKYTWEIVQVDRAMVGINTSHPNALVADAIKLGTIPELYGYANLRREVKYGGNSRIDILLEDPTQKTCYVEVKNVTLCRSGTLAEFPDAVTSRGTKHLQELQAMVAAGHRAVMFFLIQRDDCKTFDIARDIDPAYGAAYAQALQNGVEAIAYGCAISPQMIRINRSILIVGQ